jgi:hypothetical protein
VNVDLNMLYPPMLDWIAGHVNRRNIVTIYNGRLLEGAM